MSIKLLPFVLAIALVGVLCIGSNDGGLYVLDAANILGPAMPSC
jgi:hypothetical protein